jgi:vitamin B12 transporter
VALCGISVEKVGRVGRVPGSENNGDSLKIFFLCLYAGCFVGSLAAQSDASLSGTVQDTQGEVVAQATLRLYQKGSSASVRISSSNNGAYRFERLAAGQYLLEVEKSNFRTATEVVRLEASGTKVLVVKLDVAGIGQSVVVTAEAKPQTLDEIAKPITIISREEIENRNEYALGEILRNVPGMLVTNGGGPGQNTSLRIRGLRADATAVLVDGLRFRDASTTQGDASSMMSSLNFIDAERVEVMQGSGSSLYGTNAVGGVVNIVTQEGGSPLRGQLQTEGGNLGFFRGRGSISGGAFKDRLKYSAGLLHLNVANGVDGQDTNRSTGGQGFLRYDLAPTMSLSGRVWASDDFAQLNISPTTTGIPAANVPDTMVVKAIPLSPENVALLNAGQRPNYGNATYIPGRNDPDSRRSSSFYTSALIFRHSVTPRFQWQGSYQKVHTNRVFENGPAGSGSQPVVSNWSNSIGNIDTFDLRGSLQLASWISVTGGYEFEREQYLDRQNNNLPAPRSIVVRGDISQNAHAGYFASTLQLLERKLQLSFSGRAQTFRLRRPEFESSGTTNNYDRVPLLAPRNALTGDVSIAYLIARTGTKLRAHAGNAYRAPSLYERFGGGFSVDPVNGIVGFTPYGDPRLAPDRYNSFDSGVDQYFFANRVRVSATAFYTRIAALTVFDFSGLIRPETDPFGRSSGYIAGSGGISRGAELGFEARPLRGLALSGSYTYTNANQDRDLSVTGFFGAFGVPKHTMTLSATRSWTRRLDTTLDVFRSSRSYTSLFAGGRSRAYEFPAYSKVDLVSSYRFWEGEGVTTRIYGKVDNIFNRRYYQNAWLAPRATFVVGLGVGF